MVQKKLRTKVKLLENVETKMWFSPSFIIIIIIIIDFGPSWSIQSSLVHLGLVWTNSVPVGLFLVHSVHFHLFQCTYLIMEKYRFMMELSILNLNLLKKI